MLKDILILLGCVVVTILIILGLYGVFGPGAIGFVAGFALTHILIKFCEDRGIL